GELLQLRKRSENPPPPLYDDVVDAIAESTPENFRPWTPETAMRMGHIGGGLALIAAAVDLFFGGRLFPGGSGVAAAIIGGVVAVGCVGPGAGLSEVADASSTGVVVGAAGGLPMAFVSGFYTVPGTELPANFAVASVFMVIVAAASIAL